MMSALRFRLTVVPPEDVAPPWCAPVFACAARGWPCWWFWFETDGARLAPGAFVFG